MSDLIKKSDATETLNAVDVYGDGIGFEVLSHAIRDVSLLPTVEAIPVEWIKKWMEWQNSWNLEGVITLMHDWNERKEE